MKIEKFEDLLSKTAETKHLSKYYAEIIAAGRMPQGTSYRCCKCKQPGQLFLLVRINRDLLCQISFGCLGKLIGNAKLEDISADKFEPGEITWFEPYPLGETCSEAIRAILSDVLKGR